MSTGLTAGPVPQASCVATLSCSLTQKARHATSRPNASPGGRQTLLTINSQDCLVTLEDFSGQHLLLQQFSDLNLNQSRMNTVAADKKFRKATKLESQQRVTQVVEWQLQGKTPSKSCNLFHKPGVSVNAKHALTSQRQLTPSMKRWIALIAIS